MIVFMWGVFFGMLILALADRRRNRSIDHWNSRHPQRPIIRDARYTDLPKSETDNGAA